VEKRKQPVRAVDIIIKKRDRQELTPEEISFFIQGFTRGDIPDYQASAWAMAVLLNGMTDRETTDLTLAMAQSGDTLNLTDIAPLVVDKHSTGGVGDKTSLVVTPVAASCGVCIGKMSGRGLGFTGGTLDKLESIPGFRSDLSEEEFRNQLKEIGLVLTGQTRELAPADGKLYALRDVTGTVPSFPLIASSVMSKKLAGGSNAIVLDVKTGLGAFMKTYEDALHLSRMMVRIGKDAGRKMVAVISDMNQPLGHAVGNAIELKEAIATLNGEQTGDFREHCLTIASHMIYIGEKAGSLQEARHMAEKSIQDGSALEKFKQFIEAQNGDIRYVEEPDLLPRAELIEVVPSPESGYLTQIHARKIGEAACTLGAGRERKGERVDPSVGFEIYHKVGDYVEENQPLFAVHASDEEKMQAARKQVLEAHCWSSKACEHLPLFYAVVND
jgi:pyrimidine-nucleoside phosphorylase